MAIIFRDTSGIPLNKDWAVNPAVEDTTYTLPSEFRNSGSKGDFRLVIYDKNKTGLEKVNKLIYDTATSSFPVPAGFIYDDVLGTLYVPTGFNGSVSLINTAGNPLFDSSDPNEFFTKSDIPTNSNQIISKTFQVTFTNNDYENVIIEVEDLLGTANVDGDLYPDMDTLTLTITSGGTTVFTGAGHAGASLSSGIIGTAYTKNGSVLNITLTMDLSKDPGSWEAIDRSLFFLNYNIKASGNTVAVL